MLRWLLHPQLRAQQHPFGTPPPRTGVVLKVCGDEAEAVPRRQPRIPLAVPQQRRHVSQHRGQLRGVRAQDACDLRGRRAPRLRVAAACDGRAQRAGARPAAIGRRPSTACDSADCTAVLSGPARYAIEAAGGEWVALTLHKAKQLLQAGATTLLRCHRWL
jgi:hypothetical protein